MRPPIEKKYNEAATQVLDKIQGYLGSSLMDPATAKALAVKLLADTLKKHHDDAFSEGVEQARKEEGLPSYLYP